MLHLILIALVVTLLAHDAYAPRTLAGALGPWEVAALSLVPMAGLALLGWAVCWWCGRRLDRTGRGRYVDIAERAVGFTRVAGAGLHALNVMVIGWLDVLRWRLGDPPLVDETLAILPPLLLIAAGWAALHGVESRVRHAAFFAAVERGLPAHAPRTVGQFVWDQTRHQVLFLLLPILMVLGWMETVNALALRWAARWPWVETEAGTLALAAAQLAGVALVFVLSPPLVLRVWSTVSLGPGPVRERLEAMCRRQRVRARDIRVWRTRGTMINGAVMGMAAPVRYILLTDALLETLPAREVEAVMAHEVAHVKRRHMPWLMGAMVASLGLATWVVSAAASAAAWLGSGLPEGTWWPDAAASVAALAAGFAALGGVSRRFERQADAFAVRDLTLADAEAAGRPAPREATPEAVDAMAGALRRVATHNFIPLDKFFWRHGSIGDRLGWLASIVGRRLDDLPIDRRARRDKAAVVAGLVLLVAVAALSGGAVV